MKKFHRNRLHVTALDYYCRYYLTMLSKSLFVFLHSLVNNDDEQFLLFTPFVSLNDSCRLERRKWKRRKAKKEQKQAKKIDGNDRTWKLFDLRSSNCRNTTTRTRMKPNFNYRLAQRYSHLCSIPFRVRKWMVCDIVRHRAINENWYLFTHL